MCSKKATYQITKGIRPIVWILLENPHDASIEPIQVRALVDMGADASLIPSYLCQALGHSFEEGLSESSASGISGEALRTFAHSTKLTVLFPTESDADTPQTFDPIEFPCEFADQSLPFVLLGQQDFLRMFRYTQDGRAGWFSLEQVGASQGDAANGVR